MGTREAGRTDEAPERRSSLGGITLRAARRIVVAVIGTTLLLVAFVLVFLPGPAIVVLAIALGVLGLEFAWARRFLHRLKRAAKQVADGGRRWTGR